MGRERMSLGFGDDLDTVSEGGEALPALDTSAFQPRKRARVAAPELADTRKLAEAVGFRSREPKGDGPAPTATPGASGASGRGGGGGAVAGETAPASKAPTPAPAPLRRRRTGRNVQFNIKARPETIAAFTAVADANDWGFGETLEHAVALLEREYGGG